MVVTELYHRKCAVTGERTLPALEAAHIRPYAEGGEHSAANGILMRRDIHSLFDAGYVTVTSDHRFEVSRRIREEFRERAALLRAPWLEALDARRRPIEACRHAPSLA